MSNSYDFQQMQELLHAAPSPPPGYRARLIAQFVLVGLLGLQAVTWGILAGVDCRRRGRQVKPIRLQKVAGGRIFIFECMFGFVLFATISGFLSLVPRVDQYQFYFGNGAPLYNRIAFNFFSQVLMITSALFFSFSNLAGSISVRRLQSGQSSFSTRLVWIYNTSLGICLGFLWCVVVPMAIVCNSRLNSFISVHREIAAVFAASRATLAADAQDPARAALVSTLEALATEAMARKDSFKGLFDIAGSLAACVSAACVLVCAASLSFVLLLRKQSRSKIQHMLKAVNDFDAAAGSEEAEKIEVRSLSNLWWATDTVAGATEQQAQSLALARLAADLTISVPFVLIFCLHLTIYECIVFYNLDSPSWQMREYMSDGYSYSLLLTNNTILACFLFNHYKSRMGFRQDKSQSDLHAPEEWKKEPHVLIAEDNAGGSVVTPNGSPDLELGRSITLKRQVEKDWLDSDFSDLEVEEDWDAHRLSNDKQDEIATSEDNPSVQG